MFSRLLGSLLWLSVWLFAQATQSVSIASGRITGKDMDGVRVGLGIPYAAPPIGDLRWKPPQLPAPWSGVRAMDQYGPACMQAALPGVTPQMSEDCLSLNVWAPLGSDSLPVMVWIHGGAFRFGTGAQPAYSGTSLARQGVIVVTINYRLGDLGFFAHTDLIKEAGAEATGNFDLLDQIAALEWVHKNVRVFGGDPNNVTIFGESAGGSSVIHLMISPKARGLFHRAISESGGGLQRVRTLEDLERLSDGRAVEWGATSLKALRALPAKDIIAKPGPLAMGAYGPVIDGRSIPGEPGRLFTEGKQAPVPFLIGANSFEASLMTTFNLEAGSVMAMAGSLGGRVRELYGEDKAQAARQLFGDALFVGPARYLAAQMEKVERPAYSYHFSYVPERRRGQAPGAAHASEIPFVFDNLRFGMMAALATDSDRKMAETMSAYWVQFAKTGNPNRPGLQDWPCYTAVTDKLLEFGTQVAVREHFRKDKIDLLEALYRQRLAAR